MRADLAVSATYCAPQRLPSYLQVKEPAVAGSLRCHACPPLLVAVFSLVDTARLLLTLIPRLTPRLRRRYISSPSQLLSGPSASSLSSSLLLLLLLLLLLRAAGPPRLPRLGRRRCAATLASSGGLGGGGG